MQSSQGSLTKLVIILGSLTAIGPLSIDMYLPAFPQIAQYYGAPLSSVQLSLAAFFLGLAVGQLFYGPAIDRFGRKRPLFVGLTIYIVASIVCSLAPTVKALAIARFFQALGSCSGLVVPRAMVRDLFHHQQAARVFSLLMLVMGLAPILAPLAGGYIAKAWEWQAIFWVLALFSAACFISVLTSLGETKAPDSKVKMLRALHTYRDILSDKQFRYYSLAGGFASASMFAYITGSPFVFINLLGVPPENYGWIFGSNALGLIAAAQINARLLRTLDIDAILTKVFLVLPVLAIALVISAAFVKTGLLTLAVPLFLYLAMLGFTFPNTAAAALANQGSKAGSASAMMGTLQFLISSLASAAVSALHNGTVFPMVSVICACALAATVFQRLARRVP